MSDPRIVRVRPAGANRHGEHQVVTTVGGVVSYRREPCPTCPWRRDAVGEFPAEAFRISAHTAYDCSMHTFACHSSGTKRPAICAGFLLHGSTHNLAVRLALAARRIRLELVRAAGVRLFKSYRAMAEANGVPADDPALQRCR